MATVVVMWLVEFVFSGTSAEVRGWTSTLALIALNVGMF